MNLNSFEPSRTTALEETSTILQPQHFPNCFSSPSLSSFLGLSSFIATISNSSLFKKLHLSFLLATTLHLLFSASPSSNPHRFFAFVFPQPPHHGEHTLIAKFHH